MKAVAAALLALSLTACATTTGGPIRGRTAADARLAADAYRMLSTVAGAILECEAVDYAEVANSRVIGATAMETWIAHGCGKTAPFEVNFFPAPQGGYNFSIKNIEGR